MLKNLIYLFIVLSFLSCDNTRNETAFPILKGDYLGQSLPDDSAILFAPGVVSTAIADRDLTIYPDGKEIYFCRNIMNFSNATIFYIKEVNGVWTQPSVVDFAKDPNFIYIEPQISPDGSKMYFASNMPVEGIDFGIMNIWVTERINDSWGAPYPIGEPINTNTDQYFPSVTKGGTMYFTSEDSLNNEEFIFRSNFKDGKYLKPEKLPLSINGGRARFNALIATDESFIIVPTFGLKDSYGATDYYIVFKNEKDQWSQPINMGNQVNSENGQEWSASLSPDGKFLFFMSARIPKIQIQEDLTASLFNELQNKPQNGLSDIYWIKTDFIEELRKEAKS